MTTTSKLEKRPEVGKHGNFYKDSVYMRRSACASYPTYIYDQLAVNLGS